MVLKIIFKNVTMLLAKRSAEYIFSFLFIVYAARRLGPEQFGLLSFALAYTFLFEVLSDLGLRRYLNREAARDFNESREKIGSAFALKIFLSVITVAVVAISINVLGYSPETKKIVYIFSLYIACQSYQMFTDSLFRGLQKMELEAWPAFFEKPVLLVIGIALLNMGYGVLAVAVLYLALKILSLSFSLLLYRVKIGHIGMRLPGLSDALNLVKNSLPYGAVLFLAAIDFLIGTVMLSYIKGNESVGIYQVAIRLAILLMVFPEAISEAILPRMVESFHDKDRGRLKSIYAVSVKIPFYIASLASIYLIFFRKWIINISFGPDYLAASVLLPMIAGIILFRFYGYGSGAVLVATGNQNIRTVIVAACVLINILLNVILIPRYDYVGAGMSLLLASAILGISYFLVIRKRITRYFPAYFFIKVVAISLITSGISFFIPRHMVLTRFLGLGTLFIILSFIFRVLSFVELKLLREAFVKGVSGEEAELI